MKIQIFTRSMEPILYSLSSEFLPKDIERIRCTGFPQWADANNYLHYILNSDSDWVINLDEDAFVIDWPVVMDLLNYMQQNCYEYCGMPDGGVCPHRFHSWVVCNPFFNIFNVKALRQKLVDRTIIDDFKFDPEAEKLRPEFVTGKYDNDYFEPFNSFFYWLMSCSKGLYLNARTHTDELSTILLWQEQEFLYHSWFAREFVHNEVHHRRITRLYLEAKEKMKRNGIALRKPVVIITYREREKNLRTLIPALTKEIPNATIVVVEQMDDRPFNKGALYNVGFNEYEHEGDYFILHDVDLIPIEGKTDYAYCEFPTHLSAHCSQFNYQVPYPTCFGGVVNISKKHYKAVNGFSNLFKGWGGEDDHFYMSFIQKQIPVLRKACWYRSLDHERHLDQDNYQYNLHVLRSGRNFYDGASTCQYEVIEKKTYIDHIHLKVLFSQTEMHEQNSEH